MRSFFTSLPCQGLQPARLHAGYLSPPPTPFLFFWFPKDLQKSGVGIEAVEDLEGRDNMPFLGVICGC